MDHKDSYAGGKVGCVGCIGMGQQDSYAGDGPALVRPKSGVFLLTGMYVRPTGFQNAALNGREGKLGMFSEMQGLWQMYTGEMTSKAFKPANLESLPNIVAEFDAEIKEVKETNSVNTSANSSENSSVNSSANGSVDTSVEDCFPHGVL